MNKLNIGIVGYGYWGPNIYRNFQACSRTSVGMISDLNPVVLSNLEKQHPGLVCSGNYHEVTRSPEIDAVAVVTPVSTHFEIARDALMNGKHVFVEKPFTATSKQAEELIELAAKKNRTIMVDHTFLFTGAVGKIRELIDSNVLGDLYYYDSTRVNLGLFQNDIDVIWDLAPHDLSIMDHIIHEKPVAVSSNGTGHFKTGLVDVAYLTVYFETKMIAHFNVNWLSPVKVRSTFIGGQKKMLVWNDLEADEKIKVYDKGVDVQDSRGIQNLLISYRSGDMWSPRIPLAEALKNETEYFAECVDTGQTPINDGEAGLRIVRILEASSESLKQGGKQVKL